MGCGYGPFSDTLATETAKFTWMRGQVQLDTNDTEEQCMKIAASFYSTLQHKIKDKFDPRREAEAIAGFDETGRGIFTDEQQSRLFGFAK
jgi:hypothetical protein